VLERVSIDLRRRPGAAISAVRCRDAEIARVVLLRRKNNPALVGGAGVGKTAVVEDWRSASPRATCRRPSRTPAFWDWTMCRC
jgi:type VI secretion system protein VasG